MAKVIWNGNQLLRLLEVATNEIQHEISERLGEVTRDNIVINDQVRTGFMGASVYTVTPQGSTYHRTWVNGEYFDVKEGRTVKRSKAPEQPPKQGSSLMGVAADYALWPELENSFAFRSIGLVKKDAPRIVESIGRKHFA